MNNSLVDLSTSTLVSQDKKGNPLLVDVYSTLHLADYYFIFAFLPPLLNSKIFWLRKVLILKVDTI